MLGGIGHALVSSIEEALFFHTIARFSRPDFEIKGAHPFTEHYSAIGPEVLRGPNNEKLGEKSDKILHKVKDYDAVVFAGQAKSHCVAWTINDLLEQIRGTDPAIGFKNIPVRRLCFSGYFIPGAIDYTDQADADFARFARCGGCMLSGQLSLSPPCPEFSMRSKIVPLVDLTRDHPTNNLNFGQVRIYSPARMRAVPGAGIPELSPRYNPGQHNQVRATYR